MKFFSTNSPFYQFMCRLWDILQVNFFWLVFSLPIVTAGASTAAAFRVCLQLAEEREGYIYREFWKGFKENWKQGTVLEVLCLACSYIIYLDMQLFHAVENNPVMFLIAAVVTGVLAGMALIYAYPLIARYQNSLKITLKNSMIISRRYLGRTLAMLAVVALEIILWMFNKTTLFIGFLIGPACIIYTIAGMSLGVFRTVEQQNGSKREAEQTENEL